MSKQLILEAIQILPDELNVNSLINYLRELDKREQAHKSDGMAYSPSQTELVEMAALFYK